MYHYDTSKVRCTIIIHPKSDVFMPRFTRNLLPIIIENQLLSYLTNHLVTNISQCMRIKAKDMYHKNQNSRYLII